MSSQATAVFTFQSTVRGVRARLLAWLLVGSGWLGMPPGVAEAWQANTGSAIDPGRWELEREDISRGEAELWNSDRGEADRGEVGQWNSGRGEAGRLTWYPDRAREGNLPSQLWPENPEIRWPGATQEVGPSGEMADQGAGWGRIEGLGDRFFSGSTERSTSDWARRWESIPISLGGVWIADSDSELATYTVGLKFPLLFGGNSPPPIVRTGFAQTVLDAPGLGVSGDLFEYSVGVSMVRPLNDRWTLRLLAGVALASDLENTSSDAWQFRGGAIGIYRFNERWQFTTGAIALGRSDLPAVPALGAVWTPNDWSRWDLIPPNPRANFLIHQGTRWQDWLYFGGGFNGSTWGVEAPGWGDDRLTYRDLRIAMGWQRTPPAAPGQPFVRGRKYNVEIAYAFSREFELEQSEVSTGLSDAWVLRIESEY